MDCQPKPTKPIPSLWVPPQFLRARPCMAILPTSPVFPDSTKLHRTFWKGQYVHRREIAAVCRAYKFFEQNVLFPISVCGYQVFMHTPRLVVHSCFGDTHDFIVKARVQNPTYSVRPQWNLLPKAPPPDYKPLDCVRGRKNHHTRTYQQYASANGKQT